MRIWADLVKEVKERGMLNDKTVLLNKVLHSPPAEVLQLMGIGLIRTPISFPLKGLSALLRSDASV